MGVHARGCSADQDPERKDDHFIHMMSTIPKAARIMVQYRAVTGQNFTFIRLEVLTDISSRAILEVLKGLNQMENEPHHRSPSRTPSALFPPSSGMARPPPRVPDFARRAVPALGLGVPGAEVA